LLARKGRVPEAKKCIKAYLEWYHILANGKPILISSVRKILEKRAVFFQAGSSDKEGRNIIFWDASKYNVDEIPEPDLIRTLVYCLERATERPDVHQKGIVIVGNFTGYAMSNFSSRVMKSFFGTLRKYFPLVLHKLLLVNPPPWISRVITMSQAFVNKLMSRIEFINSKKLSDFIDPTNSLPYFGGTFDFDMERWIRLRYEIEGIEYI